LDRPNPRNRIENKPESKWEPAVLDRGLAAVEAACAEALDAGIASGDVILAVLARRRQPLAPPSITTPDALRLKVEPVVARAYGAGRESRAAHRQLGRRS
jgi:hypothetical protein